MMCVFLDEGDILTCDDGNEIKHSANDNPRQSDTYDDNKCGIDSRSMFTDFSLLL